MTVLLLTRGQSLSLVCATIGLSDEQIVEYAEQVSAQLTFEACGNPVLFDYQIDIARELAAWKTSDDFRQLGGGA